MISWSELVGMTEIWIESYIIEMVFTYLCLTQLFQHAVYIYVFVPKSFLSMSIILKILFITY